MTTLQDRPTAIPDTPRGSVTSSRWTSRTAVHTILIIGALYSVLPLVWLATAATKSTQDFSTTSAFEFGEWNLGHNIGALFTEEDGIFWEWIRNSLLYAGLGAAVGSLICAACGYALAKIPFPGRSLLFGLTLTGVLVPTTALAMPLYLLASELRMVNTFWAVFIPLLTNPFGVYLARVYAEASVPDEIIEAARIDGSSELRTFVRIAMPMMRPGIVTVFLFQFVAIWNNFFLPLVMLTDQHLFPMSLGLFQWSNRTVQFPQYNSLVVTGSLLAVIPLIVAFIVLQRQWRPGLAAGAVK
ncbi:carbohydrate ABC transporter permease [Williamsia sp. CHRR-6]|uniref:carbohydrate ABC transporter permease n=1 Tax=Williamsia sp. CHRR-6 TaxID=2835871 RepID=UPI001BD983B9|nr:carbohydrate ABC transporter permease [Williamsia sp. CHRR-6]MBT0567070.1 carbohydrate ABC transporter permease [Williamsia sp. CHRR-6]